MRAFLILAVTLAGVICATSAWAIDCVDGAGNRRSYEDGMCRFGEREVPAAQQSPVTRGAGPATSGSRDIVPTGPGGPERRVALVIGNNAYQHVTPLKNSVADARAFRKEIETRGFSVVYRENAGRREMNDAVEEFLGKLSSDAVSVIFYSGHGVQINSANFMIPIDLRAEKEADVAYDSVDLGRLLDRTSQAQAKFTLAVIDACRNNPFQGTGRAIGGSKGLAAPSGNASGVMVVYSAGANQQALDRLGNGDTNPNGLFTREFLKAMRTPGLKVQDAVNSVKMAVIEQAKAVGHVQTPAIYDQSVGTFTFTPGDGPAPVAFAAPAPAAPPDPAAFELSFWDSVKDSKDIADFQAYQAQFPGGRFAALATNRIRAFQQQQAAPPAAPTASPVRPAAAAVATLGVAPQPQMAAVAARPAASLVAGPQGGVIIGSSPQQVSSVAGLTQQQQQEILAAATGLTPQQLARFAPSLPAGKVEIRAFHILLESEEMAKNIIARIAVGGRFEDYVELSSDKNSRTGDLGYFKEGEMVPEFWNAAAAMPVGTISTRPVKTQFGWHVIKVVDRRPLQVQ